MSDSSKPATIGERITGALASATDELRASAKPESKTGGHPGGQDLRRHGAPDGPGCG